MPLGPKMIPDGNGCCSQRLPTSGYLVVLGEFLPTIAGSAHYKQDLGCSLSLV